MLTAIALIAGIFIWPEMTFCVFLMLSGYPVVGVIALFATFWSGSKVVMKGIKS